MSNSDFVPVVPTLAGDRKHDDAEHRGPLKEIIAQQDSLYKYISWEDPVRSLGSYLAALGFLCGAHYLPLTQLALKVIAMTLGAVTLTEFVSRSFSSNTLFARLRPNEYKKIPEGVLNDTLHDVHDFIQYAVVMAQKILMGEDLNATTFAFVVSAALFWLIKVLSPFGLAILGLTSLYIAPLVISPQGREIADNARVRAEEMANAAVEGGKSLAESGKEKATQLSSHAQDTARNASQAIGATVQSGQQTTAGLAKQAQNTVSDVSGAATQNLQKTTSAGAPSQHTSNTEPFTSQVMNQASQVSNSAADTAKKLVPASLLNSATPNSSSPSHQSSHQPGSTAAAETDYDYSDSSHYHATASDHLRQPVTALSGQLGGIGEGASSSPRSRTSDDTTSYENIMDRPRGVIIPEKI